VEDQCSAREEPRPPVWQTHDGVQVAFARAWEVEAWRFNRGLHAEEGKRVANRSIATVGRFHRICKL